MPLNVMTWNMQGNQDAWARIKTLHEGLHVDIALLQEAKAPLGQWPPSTHPDRSEKWSIDAHSDVRRNFSSAVALLNPKLVLRPVIAGAINSSPHDSFVASHPGQFSVADVLSDDGTLIVTVVSLYGIWDRDERYLFSEATLHRAISDLTAIFQNPGRPRILVAGDLNVYWQWDRSTTDVYWAHRYNTVFDRLAAYDLRLVGPHADQPLDRCDCGLGDDCRHARTFAFQRKPTNRPFQLDYVFATSAVTVEGCRVVSDDSDWQYSDHLPVLTTLR